MSLSTQEKDKAAEPASTAESSTTSVQSATEPVSLRPGGGSGFSFRPGGGFFKGAAAKAEPPKEPARTDTKSAEQTQPVLAPQFGKFGSAGFGRPGISADREASVAKQEEVEEKPAEPEPDTFTNKDKKFYHPQFLLKFREHYAQPSEELQEAFKEVPDVDRSSLPTSSFFDGSSGGRFTQDDGPKRGRGFPSASATGVISSGGSGYRLTGPPLSSLYATPATTAAAAPAAAAATPAPETAEATAASTEAALPSLDTEFTPNLANMLGSLGPVSASALSGSYAGGRGGRQPQRPPQPRPSEQLRTSATPWSLSSAIVKDEKDRVARQITSTLNKLTLDNFGSLSRKLMEIIVGITEPAIYEEAVFLIYDKSVSEPNFSHMYAELCVKLNQVNEKQLLNDPNVTFRKVILNRCQSEFEKIATKAGAVPAVPLKANGEPITDPDELTARKTKERRLRTGNIKFVGELFKSQLLSEKIVHTCIQDLLASILQKVRQPKETVDRESLENDSELLCKLLSTTGKLLDIPKAKNYIDKYFQYLTAYQTDDSFSPRVRFMFKDVIELRSRQWVPRRDENAPKTIEEVHLEALRKDLEDAALSDLHYREEDMPRQEPIQILRPDRSGAGGKPGPAAAQQPRGPPPGMSKAAPPAAAAKKGRLGPGSVTADKADDIFGALVDDYMSSGELRDAVDSIGYLKAGAFHAKLVEIAVNMSLERSEADREAISRLFQALSRDKILTADQAVSGFRAIASVLDDLIIDIPTVVDLLLKMLRRAAADGVAPKDKLAALDKRFASL
eukprot:TRINITY_DN26518_c0_g1_i1.p1 TRINITY_DN26518_c0_g1~~TRINITY_DN26518_c0_g1_i1.p1  ORF type:complete len:790 (-),score=302.62 TRINITY_DN26518_c0_g1_i1:146-2515(-)